jgi:hypothetical protein
MSLVKKNILFVFIFLLICCFLSGNLTDFYKKGLIKLEADPNFGRETDWNTLLYDFRFDLLYSPQGDLFVAFSPDHCIYKFNPEGKYVTKFGQKGQGPGDFYYPGDLSILDGRHLVIGEYATARRISLFDFDGNFIKLLKAENSSFYSTALKNGKIAYTTHKYGPTENFSQKFTTVIIIKDVKTGREKAVDERNREQKHTVLEGGIRFVPVVESGEVIITQTKDGNLVVGLTTSPELKIYSPEGEFLQAFRLKMDPLPVTRDYIRKYKESIIRNWEEQKFNKRMVEAVKKSSLDNLFDEYVPYYKEILVDSEGNILIFKYTDCFGDCLEIFQVYSPEGQYICDVTIEKGIYDFQIDRRFKNIVFTSQAIYGLFPLKDSEDFEMRLVRVNVPSHEK